MTRALLCAIVCLWLTAGALAARSTSERAKFQRAHPCPATEQPRGACPGYEVDHIIPLKCGGADKPHNMQWLTVQQHKIKTRREAKDCRRR